MNLPENFFFSQNKLQDYLDCPRRFELKHFLKQDWPAIQSEPVRELEHHFFLGGQFHLFVQQYFHGMKSEQILQQSTDPILNTWWAAFEKYESTLDIQSSYSEIQLSCYMNGIRFIGIIDLLVIDSNRNIIIYDWKTNRKRPSSTTLKNRIQSKLYPLMVYLNHNQFYNNPISASKISMMYWFVNSPNQPYQFQYNKEQFESDQNYLLELTKTIAHTPLGEFSLTNDQEKCIFCNYRSLCVRGKHAGISGDDLDNFSDDENFDINFDEISELEF